MKNIAFLKRTFSTVYSYLSFCIIYSLYEKLLTSTEEFHSAAHDIVTSDTCNKIQPTGRQKPFLPLFYFMLGFIEYSLSPIFFFEKQILKYEEN